MVRIGQLCFAHHNGRSCILANWDAISLRRIKAACDSKDGCKRGGMAMLLLRLELSFASLNDIF